MSEATTSPEITLTERAAEHVRERMADRAVLGLRLGVKTSGCSGFGYVVDYAEEVDEDDCVIEQHGIKVVISEKHLPFLQGTEVDYVQDGLNRRFDFRNPNVRDMCGCGESFTV